MDDATRVYLGRLGFVPVDDGRIGVKLEIGEFEMFISWGEGQQADRDQMAQIVEARMMRILREAKRLSAHLDQQPPPPTGQER